MDSLIKIQKSRKGNPMADLWIVDHVHVDHMDQRLGIGSTGFKIF
jgi:hypothetical protein